MKSLTGIGVAWLFLGGLAPAQAAPFLMVDFGDTTQIVQAGWEAGTNQDLTNNENRDLAIAMPPHTDVTPFGTVTHSLGTTEQADGFGLDFRDRAFAYPGENANFVHPRFGQIGHVLQDVMKSNDYSEPLEIAGLDLKFIGLNAGTYRITTFHHDYFGVPDWQWANFDILVEEGAGNGFTTVHTNLSASSNGTDPLTNPAYYETLFTSPGPEAQITVRIMQFGAPQSDTPTNGFVLEDFVPAETPGDFDADGDVDGADFVAWQTNFPTATGATLADGDADADGDVDGADFVVWQTNFPFTPGSGVAPVPEPASMWLLSLGGIIALAHRKLHRRRTEI